MLHIPHGAPGTHELTRSDEVSRSWQVGLAPAGQSMTPVDCHFSPGNTFATEALNRLEAMSASTWR